MRRLFVAIALIMASAGLIAGSTAGSAEPIVGAVRVNPGRIDFGTKSVGATYYDKVRITNSSGVPLNVIVEAGLPDDFGFGLLPGSTCPVLAPSLMAPKESCVAVVRFTPSESFVGWQATGEMLVTTTDPTSGSIAVASVPVLGMGKL